ncbi:hypothetical protein NNA51_01600 [Cutibacterium acnes]|nr:hypothetical protein [Cutibacterium acnes]MCP9334905.1 hypothetical protein [Cutibacterium acnes]
MAVWHHHRLHDLIDSRRCIGARQLYHHWGPAGASGLGPCNRGSHLD